MNHTEDTALVVALGTMKKKRIKDNSENIINEYNETIGEIFPSNEDMKIKYREKIVDVNTERVLSRLQKHFSERKNVVSRLNDDDDDDDDYYYDEELQHDEDEKDLKKEISMRCRKIFLDKLDKYNGDVDIKINYITRQLELTKFSRGDINYSEVEKSIKKLLKKRDWLMSQIAMYV